MVKKTHHDGSTFSKDGRRKFISEFTRFAEEARGMIGNGIHGRGWDLQQGEGPETRRQRMGFVVIFRWKKRCIPNLTSYCIIDVPGTRTVLLVASYHELNPTT